MWAIETSRPNGHSISIVWNDKDRETYKSRVDTTPGHVLWGSGQCQVQCGAGRTAGGEVRGWRPWEDCREPWAVLRTAASVLGEMNDHVLGRAKTLTSFVTRPPQEQTAGNQGRSSVT